MSNQFTSCFSLRSGQWRLSRSLKTALTMMLFLLAASDRSYPQAFAQESSINVSFAAPPKEPVPVYVLAGQSCLVVFDQPIGRLAVSNTDNAEAVLVAPNQMMINGKMSGRARFTAWSKDTTQFLFFDVDVRVNLAQIDSQVRALFPGMDIRLSQANGAVVVSGNIPITVLKQVNEIVSAAGYKTVNLTGAKPEEVLQVQLNVKVAEVQRNKLSEFAYSPLVNHNGYYGTTSIPGSPLSTTGITTRNETPAGVNSTIELLTTAAALNVFFMAGKVTNYLRALQTQGALRALAEPNLVALNGKSASFLAGGEIPVPIVQSAAAGTNAVTIVWKEYGVRLNFTPTILDEQHIRLELEPEVSTLDYASAVVFQGFRIPGLRVRRAKTSIELSDGQTFGIAGLLDNNETKTMGKVPLLADIPIIGELFKSRSFQRNETEVVFLVTPKLVKAWNPDQVPTHPEAERLRNGSPLGTRFPEEAKPVAAPDAPAATEGEADKNQTDKNEAEKETTPAEAKPVTNEDGTVPPASANPSAEQTPVVPENGAPTNPEAIPPASTPPPASNTSPQNPTSGEKSGSSSGSNAERSATPKRNPAAVHALQWKLNVPAASTITAQTRPQQ